MRCAAGRSSPLACAGRTCAAPSPSRPGSAGTRRVTRPAVPVLRADLRLACGARRRAARVLTWWHWTAGWALESQAVAAGRPGHHEAMRAHVEGKKTRAACGRIVVACFAVAAVAVGLAVAFAPRWLLALLGLVVVAVLAKAGRPDGRQVIRP